MSVLALENWSATADAQGIAINAWVLGDTHREFQKLIPGCYSNRQNWGTTGYLGRMLFYEYNIWVAHWNMNACPIVDGWYFTVDLLDPVEPLDSVDPLDSMDPLLDLELSSTRCTSFTLAFNDRKQNMNFRIQNREVLQYMLGRIPDRPLDFDPL